MACNKERAVNRIRDIISSSELDGRSTEARQIMQMASEVLNSIENKTDGIDLKGVPVIEELDKDLELNVTDKLEIPGKIRDNVGVYANKEQDKFQYWTNRMNNFLSGGTIEVFNSQGGRYTVRVRRVSVRPDGFVDVVVNSSNSGKEYRYIVNPYTGRTNNDTFIGIFENMYDRLRSFSSSPSATLDTSRYDKIEEDLNNDITKVKSIVRELEQYDNISISEEHSKQLDDTISLFVDGSKEFIPRLRVFLDTEAEENGGHLVLRGKRRGDLYLAAGSRDQQFAGDMSTKEVVAHELIHAAVEFGREYNKDVTAPTMRRIYDIHERIIDTLVPEDLMPTNSPYSSEIERENAEKLLDYMKGRNGVAEFIAHGLTNEALIRKLKETPFREKERPEGNIFERMWSLVEELFNRAFDVVRGERGASKYDVLLKLSLDLAKANNKTVNRAKRGYIEKAGEQLDSVNKYINNLATKLGDRFIRDSLPDLPEGANKIQSAIYIARHASALAFNPKFRATFERMLSTMLGEFGRPEGTIQSIIRGFRDTDSLQRSVEIMGQASDKIDQTKLEIRKAISDMVIKGFEERPSNEELNALGLGVVETDLSVLNEYSDSQIKSMFNNEEALNNRVAEVQASLFESTSRNNAFYYSNQAKKLGKFMATGLGDETTQLNADSIAMKLNDEPNRIANPDREIVRLIDELATLESIRFLSQETRDIVSNVMNKDFLGVKNIMAYQQSLKSESDKVFEDAPLNKVKGYSKDILDSNVSIQVASLSREQELLDQGFKLERRLVKSRHDESTTDLGLFVSNDYAVQEFRRAGIRLTDKGRKGTTITDVHRIDDSRVGRVKARREIEKINVLRVSDVATQHTKLLSDDELFVGRVPIINRDGTPIDYRYTMSKDEKARLLNRNTSANLLLGHAHASIYDKVNTSSFNERLVDLALEDRDKNYTGGKFGRNGKEYVEIGPAAETQELRELWAVLPTEVRNIINRSSEEGFLPVRRDLLNSYFGYRDITITDNELIGRLTNTQQKSMLRQAENVWKDIVAWSKVDIVIRTPAVLIGNVISNFILSLQLGVNPSKVLAWQLEGVQELRNYRNWHREWTGLVAARNAGNLTGENVHRIETLERRLEQSPIRDMIDRGLFTSITEDIGSDELQNTNRIGSLIDSALEGKPKFVQDGVNTLFLTERSSIYKALLTATQYSDFVARYGLYRSYRERGFSKNRALNQITDAFINYDVPDSKVLQYLNNIGLVMFTKYFLRIQKVLRQGGQRSPLQFIAVMLGQEVMTGDLEDVMDQSLIDKNWSNIVHMPWEHLKNVIVPSGTELAYTVYDKTIG
jgi:hypothetical protein